MYVSLAWVQANGLTATAFASKCESTFPGGLKISTDTAPPTCTTENRVHHYHPHPHEFKDQATQICRLPI